MSLSVSLPRLVVKRVDQACALRTAQHFIQIDREIPGQSPGQRVFLVHANPVRALPVRS
jgi:hypothetical protein